MRIALAFYTRDYWSSSIAAIIRLFTEFTEATNAYMYWCPKKAEAFAYSPNTHA